MYSLLYHFSPLILFIGLYVGSGIYFSYVGIDMAFYQVSPVVAILPALMLAWTLQKGSTTESIHRFLDGARHRDIITMCFIFMLAGAISVVTKHIGCLDETVNFALYLVPAQFLLIGIFIAAAFISTAIGTSLGTIATIAPIAVGLAAQGAFPMVLGVATVVGGAMFGDNLSLISDTTIAAVVSQGADWRKKFRLNLMIAAVAGLVTVGILFSMHEVSIMVEPRPFSVIYMLPYFLLIGLALLGFNVFVVLISSLCCAGLVGIVLNPAYTVLMFNADIVQGFASMHEIVLLSLLIGGLSGLMQSGIKKLRTCLSTLQHVPTMRTAQYATAGIASLFDALIANNTIAIIVCGDMVKEFNQAAGVPPHYTAAWLDIFSCVVQGVIPYGAQILLASSIGGVSPLAVAGSVYYCYVLALVACLYIFVTKKADIH